MRVWRLSAPLLALHVAGAMKTLCRPDSSCRMYVRSLSTLRGPMLDFTEVRPPKVPPDGRLGRHLRGQRRPSATGIDYRKPPLQPAKSTPATMSLPSQSARPLACLKQALRQCRAERQQQQTRSYAAAAGQVQYPSLQTRYPMPSKSFRTSQTTKQNRKRNTMLSPLGPC